MLAKAFSVVSFLLKAELISTDYFRRYFYFNVMYISIVRDRIFDIAVNDKFKFTQICVKRSSFGICLFIIGCFNDPINTLIE